MLLLHAKIRSLHSNHPDVAATKQISRSKSHKISLTRQCFLKLAMLDPLANPLARILVAATFASSLDPLPN
jgi:hypothetical protein